MSTILRALQKVEKDTTQDAAPPGTTQTIRAAYTISRGVTARWYIQQGKHILKISACVAVVCLVGFGIFSLFITDGSVDSGSQQITPQTTGNHHRIAENRGPSRPKSYAPKPTYDPNHQPGRYASKGYGIATPKETTIDPQGHTNPSLETETIPPTAENEDIYADSPHHEEPEEVLETDPEALHYAQLKILENGKLELQAISYAKTPEARMAVINNEIIREGRSISGYKVLYIGPEMVVVEQGGQQWRIIFMAR